MNRKSINVEAIHSLSKKDLDGLKEAGHPHYKEVEKVWLEGQKAKEEKPASDPAKEVKK